MVLHVVLDYVKMVESVAWHHSIASALLVGEEISAKFPPVVGCVKIMSAIATTMVSAIILLEIAFALPAGVASTAASLPINVRQFCCV